MPINNKKYSLRIKRKVKSGLGNHWFQTWLKKNCGPAMNAIVEYAVRFKFDSFDILILLKCNPRVFWGEKFIKLTNSYGNISTMKWTDYECRTASHKFSRRKSHKRECLKTLESTQLLDPKASVWMCVWPKASDQHQVVAGFDLLLTLHRKNRKSGGD